MCCRSFEEADAAAQPGGVLAEVLIPSQRFSLEHRADLLQGTSERCRLPAGGAGCLQALPSPWVCQEQCWPIVGPAASRLVGQLGGGLNWCSLQRGS